MGIFVYFVYFIYCWGLHSLTSFVTLILRIEYLDSSGVLRPSHHPTPATAMIKIPQQRQQHQRCPCRPGRRRPGPAGLGTASRPASLAGAPLLWYFIYRCSGCSHSNDSRAWVSKFSKIQKTPNYNIYKKSQKKHYELYNLYIIQNRRIDSVIFF